MFLIIQPKAGFQPEPLAVLGYKQRIISPEITAGETTIVDRIQQIGLAGTITAMKSYHTTGKR